jgi:hypothetical protein
MLERQFEEEFKSIRDEFTPIGRNLPQRIKVSQNYNILFNIIIIYNKKK